MFKAVIIGDTVTIVGKKELKSDDFFSKEFFSYSDSKAMDYTLDSYFVNELYLYFIQPYLAFDLFLKEEKITLLNIEEANYKLKLLGTDLAIRNNIQLEGSTFFTRATIWVKSRLELVTSYIYLCLLLLRIPFNSEDSIFKLENYEKFAIVRSPASKNKINKLGIEHEYEDPKSKTSIYRLFGKLQRLKWVTLAFLDSMHYLNLNKRFLQSKLGKKSAYLSDDFYGRRIVHTLLYKHVVNEFLANAKELNFYTGNNLDRFAFIEDEIVSKYELNSVCIPHGLEYGFKFPVEFTGNQFFTTSMEAANHLNKLYDSNKFIFKESITNSFFKLDYLNQTQIRRLVYFSESREQEVNHQIIGKLLPLLKDQNIELRLKLHPKDNKESYSKYGLIIIDNMNEALANNLCFARKSTTLLEALYNNSKAAAILINKKDDAIFHNFPSLQTKELKSFFTIDDLFEWIKSNW